MTIPTLPAFFSTIAKLNVLHTPLQLRITSSPTVPAVDKLANAAKAELVMDLVLHDVVPAVQASLLTTLHACLLMIQEMGINAIRQAPENAAPLVEQLRRLATMLETATPADIAAAEEDRAHARELLKLLAQDANTSQPPTVN